MKRTDPAYARYRELLYRKGHGYPFWIPELSDTLPEEQRAEGVRLGDVGILTDDGGFHFLWNVHLPADHPYNNKRVPPDFTPLAPLNEAFDVRKINAFHVEPSTVYESEVEKHELGGKLQSKLTPSVGGGASYEFTGECESAAILTLPRGGVRVDAVRRDLYKNYAASHAMSWYRYINQELQLGVQSGALYLVTGTDKCSSWGVASFSKPKESHSFTLKFVAHGAASAGVDVKNSWEVDSGVPRRTKAVDPLELSQCVFARGFVISVREGFFAKLFGMSVKTTSTYGAHGRPSSIFARGAGAESDPDVHVLPIPEPFAQASPPALLGDELLKKNDDASFAIVHDEDWIASTQRGDLVQARGPGGSSLQTLIEHAATQTKTIVVDGVCIVVDADDVNPSITAEADCTSSADLRDASAALPQGDGVRVDKVADAILRIQQQGQFQATRVVSSPNFVEWPEVVPARYLTRVPVVERTSVSLSSPDVQPRLFALIIGINVYEHAQAGTAFRNLKGAVADADDMLDFLTSALAADRSHIINLRDQEATRDGILDAFATLASDDRIKRGDPIIIFFAGHGSASPGDWNTDMPDSRVDMLIPYNFLPKTTSQLNQQGILYTTIEKLLATLAKQKSDNITVILDACRSGSFIRDPLDLSVLSRGITLPASYTILPSMQDEVYRRAAFPYELSSHTLLSGCSNWEYAYECNGRGFFTQALLKLLRYTNVCNLSYRGVIEQLPDFPCQHPQCEGKNSARALFDGKAPGRSWVLYPVKVTETAGQDKTITLCGGEVHGITEGAEFDVFTTRDLNAQPLCRLVATVTHACSADLAPVAGSVEQDIPQPAWALQATVGKRVDLVVALSPAREFLHVLEIALEMGNRPNKRIIRFVDPNVPHEFELQSKGNHVVFKLADKLCNDAWLNQLESTVSADDPALIYAVVEGAADFFFHLRWSNPAAPLAGKVVLEAFELEHKFDEERGGFSDTPSSANLIEGGLMQLVITENQPTSTYGFKLVSSWPCDLYAWVFMFNVSDLSVQTLYRPDLYKPHPDPSLLARGSLTIGYGAGGAAPCGFILQKPQNDVSYLKVYVTSEPVDLSHIAQDSPFEPARKLRIREGFPLHGVWDTVLVAIVQMVAK